MNAVPKDPGARSEGGKRMIEGLAPGTRVEVRTSFDRSWARGFEVAEADNATAYQVRRLSDGSVLPKVIAADDVRRERRSSMWWV